MSEFDSTSSDLEISVPKALRAQPNEFALGQLIAERYRIIEVIGRGGMGVVYKVEHVFLEQMMALKSLDRHKVNTAAWQRFQQEAKAASLLDHPNLVKVRDFGVLGDDQAFLVMDLVPGETLAERLARSGPLPVGLVISLFIQTARAIHYAHGQGIIHRDIKPSNILIEEREGQEEPLARIVDFGIAKMTLLDEKGGPALTATGELVGTPFYMSPEQCMGIPIDARADQYSLGCTIFEALTGTPPFCTQSPLSTLLLHKTEEPPSLQEASLGKEFPPALEAVLRRTLAKDPDMRYPDLEELARELNIIRSGGDVPKLLTTMSLSATAKAEPKAPVKTGLPWFVKGLAVLLVGALAGVVSSSLLKRRPATTESKAQPVISQSKVSPEENELHITKPFSHLERGPTGEMLRVFEFPDDVAVGEISRAELLKVFPARGKLVFPVTDRLYFSPSWQMCNQPVLIDLFRPDDFVSFSLAKNENATDEVAVHLKRLTGLEEVDVQKTEVTNAALTYLDQLPHLKRLTVYGCNITCDAIAAMHCIPRLELLFAGAVADRQPGLILRALQGSKAINSLSISRDGVTDAEIALVANLKTIEKLYIIDNPKITPKGLAMLAALPRLKELTMAKMDTKKYLDSLRQLKHLRAICIDNTPGIREKVAAVLPQGCKIYWYE